MKNIFLFVALLLLFNIGLHYLPVSDQRFVVHNKLEHEVSTILTNPISEEIDATSLRVDAPYYIEATIELPSEPEVRVGLQFNAQPDSTNAQEAVFFPAWEKWDFLINDPLA